MLHLIVTIRMIDQKSSKIFTINNMHCIYDKIMKDL